MEIKKTLGEFIVECEHEHLDATGELSAVFAAIRLAAKILHREINKAGLADIVGSAGEDNIQGEAQQKLDVFANERFKLALAGRGVCGLASEEEDQIVIFEEKRNLDGKYVVLIDPLDGSSNIDVNVSVGTIFSIYRRISPQGGSIDNADFLQKGTAQVASGYVVYGSSTMMVFTTGKGVNGFTYDPSLGVFCLSHPNMTFPHQGEIYSINEGQYRDFPEGVKHYIKHCQELDPPSKRPYTSRYIGSLVSDIHRNLIKGGIYCYPSSGRYPNGKLRLLYECNPMAFIIEQAGGKALGADNKRILEVEPTDLHQRTPFYAGSQEMVEKLEEFMMIAP